MSEEILKALTQLFAIITKQDGGVSDKEREFVITFFKTELDQDSIKSYLELYDKYSDYNKEKEERKETKLTSVRDSVKTLAICKKINKTLTQKQKVVVLIKIFELVGSDGKFTPQRMEIIDTISTVFNFDKHEFKLIESFIFNKIDELDHSLDNILIVKDEVPERATDIHYVHSHINGEIRFIAIRSVDLYFVKYLGNDEILLNGFIMKNNQSYLFSHGSTLKTQLGSALYYSELIRNFIADDDTANLSFNANNLWFTFPNGGIGLRDINISEGNGQLIGIMGASGAGKTTLLNTLAGIHAPSEGEILINGYNIYTQKENIEGVIGYVAQDDLLIEELTVYQNLFYNAKLCFADLSDEEIDTKVMEVLTNLGLDQRKDLRVGSVLDKTISGGQRKRLNIALELIREPGVMFVDEPTSGLSSRDSENVIDLLKELTLKGKLIFVVIHQPSSDIYKMFDKMIIMDTGGYQVFYGNPLEAVTYFKRVTNQVDAGRGVCPTCGNVNPEQIFNIVEAKVVDEYGQLTNKRKINPQQWEELYRENYTVQKIADVDEDPPKNLNIPTRIKQTFIYTTRDFLAKISNTQYLLINLLEAPVLAIILAFIIRYRSAGQDEYIFRFNENIPAFFLMAIIVAMFMGLTVSAEEIIKDRKILRRESFLNLSWNSYLLSKVAILFLLSAIQTLTFVVIGNLILEIREMTVAMWLVLFTVSCFSNVLGLNISSAFNSAVTVYIIIPLLLIPQMILSGLLFPFDKLNNAISSKGKVPVIADFMASRWAYEAMAVYQFKNNSYQAPYYPFDKLEKEADFKSAYLFNTLEDKLNYINRNFNTDSDSIRSILEDDFRVLRNELSREPYKEGLADPAVIEQLTLESYDASLYPVISGHLAQLKDHYLDIFADASLKKTRLEAILTDTYGVDISEYKNKYSNESLNDLLRNITTENRFIVHNGKVIQLIDPIYNDPEPDHPLDYRAQFFMPTKHFLGVFLPTFVFDIIVIWLMTIILYIALYYEWFKKLVDGSGNIKIKRKKH